MKTKFFFLLILTCGIFTISASAQLNNRTHSKARIAQGVRSGELTGRETVRLVREQREIRQDIRRAKSDGCISPRERINIRQDQRQASRHIYRARHNRFDRN